MGHDSRSTKRRRTSDDGSPILIIIAPGRPFKSTVDQEVFTRHADFWLEDGNLILLAGSTAFCVLRSLLVKNSAVFADMFATASLNATEICEGCPVARLPDHPEDLRDFLQYLMPCSPLKLRSDGTPIVEFAELHAALHLAHKYQCPDVEKRALFVLKKYYTSRFAEYDAYDASVATLAIPPWPAAIAAVNIARLTETPSMLPFAFYRVCDLAGEAMDGYTRRDGSVEHLAPEDLKLCIGAQRELAWELAGLVEAVFSPSPPSAHCRMSGKCARARDKIHKIMRMRVRGECDALACQHNTIAAWAAEFGLCKVCRREMLRRDVEERRRVWMLLPEMFGLGEDECGFTDGREGESDSDSD